MSESNSITRSAIYMIRCTAIGASFGKVYVGSAVNFRKRWNNHREDLGHGRHVSRHLQNAWNKYGAEAFAWSILEYVPIEGLTKAEAKLLLLGREQWHLDNNKAFDRRHGFNIASVAGSSLGMTHTPESRAKMAASARGVKNSPEHIAKTAASQRGKKMSPEACRKIGDAMRGKTLPPEVRAKISETLRGRKLAPEHRAKISETLRGRKKLPQAIAKTAAANRGRKRSPEARANIAAANRRRAKPARTNEVQFTLFD